jgi:hypothetical protein
VSLFLIAANEVRKTRAKKKQKQADSGTPRDAGQPPVTAAVSLVDPLAESGAVREAA